MNTSKTISVFKGLQIALHRDRLKIESIKSTKGKWYSRLVLEDDKTLLVTTRPIFDEADDARDFMEFLVSEVCNYIDNHVIIK